MYAIDENNHVICKEVIFISARPLQFELKENKFNAENPELIKTHEENQCLFTHKQITKKDFDEFGKKWIWNPSPSFGTEGERLSI